MAIPSSGQTISFGALRTEFVGGNSALPIGALYRGGNNILAKNARNPGVNDAAPVPTSGALDMSDYYGTAKSFSFTYSSNATDQNASALFGSNDYELDYPKRIVVPSSVTLGTNNTSEYALEIDADGDGTITITNNGNIIGAGGAGGAAGSAGAAGGNGAAGGDAMKASVACVVINNGSLLAGGGGVAGGGGGGAGGALQQQSQGTGQENPGFGSNSFAWFKVNAQDGQSNTILGASFSSAQGSRAKYNSNPTLVALPFNATSYTQGNNTFIRGNQVSSGAAGQGMEGQNFGQKLGFNISRQFPQSQQTQVAGHAGAAGGAGGLGRGHNNLPGGDAGADGADGTTGQAGNGGNGGNGAAGGAYGTAGTASQAGQAGTNSTANGSAGGAAGSVGAAGNKIEGFSNVTYTNNGTEAGGTE